MKILSKKIRVFTLVLLLGFGWGACSTGTDSGATNVEESDAKDKNPNDHNAQSNQQPVSHDSTNLENAYEKTDPDKGVRDRDNDGLADQPKQ
jgi:hypothetical protein